MSPTSEGASPDYLSITLTLKKSEVRLKSFNFGRRCTDCRLETTIVPQTSPIIVRSSSEIPFLCLKTHRIHIGSFMWLRYNFCNLWWCLNFKVPVMNNWDIWKWILFVNTGDVLLSDSCACHSALSSGNVLLLLSCIACLWCRRYIQFSHIYSIYPVRSQYTKNI